MYDCPFHFPRTLSNIGGRHTLSALLDNAEVNDGHGIGGLLVLFYSVIE